LSCFGHAERVTVIIFLNLVAYHKLSLASKWTTKCSPQSDRMSSKNVKIMTSIWVVVFRYSWSSRVWTSVSGCGI